jgi:large subunit ribosomal protein L9
MGRPIRVVLQESVANVGTSGDVVRVRPGFARNFLIPRGLAAPATPANLARIDEIKRQAAVRLERDLEEARSVAAELERTSVKLERAVGEERKMYGSVTSRDIEEAYASAGLAVDRKKIQLPEPIKELGLHEVKVRLHGDVEATLRVEVIKKS